MKYHSEDETYYQQNYNHPNESTKLTSSSTYNVGSMLVHSPYIPARSMSSPRSNNRNKRSNNNSSRNTKKQVTKKTRGRKKIGTYRRTKRSGDYYDTWKGRISVHMEVVEFDLKLLEKNILSKSDLLVSKGWEMMSYYDVIRLWLPSPSSSSANDDNDLIRPTKETRISEFLDEENGEDKMNLNNTEDPVLLPLQNEMEGASTPEVYIFSFGAVVFWNFENDDHEKIWMSQNLFDVEGGDDVGEDEDEDEGEAIGQQNPPDAVESANDEMAFMYGTSFHIHRDIVQLQTVEYGEKLALSFSLAKSANLSIFEWRLDQVIERNSHIPEQLARFGRIHMSRKEISMEIGRIFLVKSGINLENNILDTPEEFWEDDKFYGEYKKAMEYFDIDSRLELVNTRLEVMHDMNQILIEATQSHHASMLEWTVIILIVFEILVEVYRSYRDFQMGDYSYS